VTGPRPSAVCGTETFLQHRCAFRQPTGMSVAQCAGFPNQADAVTLGERTLAQAISQPASATT
jgi:hypothetical protein